MSETLTECQFASKLRFEWFWKQGGDEAMDWGVTYSKKAKIKSKFKLATLNFQW
jgi:hypothetical protein